MLAPGFQTFGDDYQIDQPEMEIEIRLKRPGDQLSIYDKDKQQAQPPADRLRLRPLHRRRPIPSRIDRYAGKECHL